VRKLHDELQQHAARLEQRVADRTAELEAAKTRAEAADQAKTSFLATMSHELRTPLNSIIGFTEVLLSGMSGALTNEQGKQLGIVQQSSRHLLALITDVLDMAKIEAGQLRLDYRPFDLRCTIERACGAFAHVASERGLRFSSELGEFDAHMSGDERRAEQVLNNLLSNALKFTHSGGVAVSMEQSGESFLVAVTDTGSGVRPEDIEKLFRRFSQMENARTGTQEGTGLGLAISRHLVESMGGTITVRSDFGKGSRFEFVLPRVPKT
jgi:signal transduction histidine kinase